MEHSAAGETARLRAAAVGYCRGGWPVLPVCLRTGRMVSRRAPEDTDVAGYWWEQPYGIASAVGERFDVVELPSWVGELVLPGVEHVATVLEVERPLSRAWWFLVDPGAQVVQEFRRLVPGGCLRSKGTVLLPPTPIAGGTSRWVARQWGRGFPERLPRSLCVCSGRRPGPVLPLVVGVATVSAGDGRRAGN